VPATRRLLKILTLRRSLRRDCRAIGASNLRGISMMLLRKIRGAVSLHCLTWFATAPGLVGIPPSVPLDSFDDVVAADIGIASPGRSRALKT